MTLVGKDWKKYDTIKIGHFGSFLIILEGKDWKKCKMIKIGHSESLWTTFVTKVANAN